MAFQALQGAILLDISTPRTPATDLTSLVEDATKARLSPWADGTAVGLKKAWSDGMPSIELSPADLVETLVPPPRANLIA